MNLNIDQLRMNTELFTLNSDKIIRVDLKEVTFSELLSLKQSDSLLPHQRYRITDYRTVHYLHAVKPNDVPMTMSDTSLLEEELNINVSVVPVEPLIVKALTSNTLHYVAFSETYPTDVIHYELTPTVNQLDTPATGHFGVITYRKDSRGNEAPFDFRNVIFPRWESVAASGSFDSWVSKGNQGSLSYVRAFNPNSNINLVIKEGNSLSPMGIPYTLPNVYVENTSNNLTLEGFGLSFNGSVTAPNSAEINYSSVIKGFQLIFKASVGKSNINSGNATFYKYINGLTIKNGNQYSLLEDIDNVSIESISNSSINASITNSFFNKMERVTVSGDSIELVNCGTLYKIQIGGRLDRCSIGYMSKCNITGDVSGNIIGSISRSNFANIKSCNLTEINNSSFTGECHANVIGFMDDCNFIGEVNYLTVNSCKNLDVNGRTVSVNIPAITTQLGDTTSRLTIAGDFVNVTGAYIGYNGGNMSFSDFEQISLGRIVNSNFTVLNNVIFPQEWNGKNLLNGATSNLNNNSVSTIINQGSDGNYYGKYFDGVNDVITVL